MEEGSVHHFSCDVSVSLRGTLADWLPGGLQRGLLSQETLQRNLLKIDGVCHCLILSSVDCLLGTRGKKHNLWSPRLHLFGGSCFGFECMREKC